TILTSVRGADWRIGYDTVVAAVEQRRKDRNKHEAAILIVTPGTRQLKEQGPALNRAIKAATVFAGNVEEAQTVVAARGEAPAPNPEDLMRQVKGLGNDMQAVSLTDGANGSWLLDEYGKVYYTSIVRKRVRI